MKRLLMALATLVALGLAGCDRSGEQEQSAPESTRARAEKLALENIIVDGHIDVPHRIHEEYENVAQATDSGNFDYPRAVEGGLDAPFMSIYVPAELQGTGRAKAHADELIDSVERLARDNPDKFALAYSVADVRENFENGLISLPMGMENGAPIEGDLDNLTYFHDRGIRYITLAHSKSNHISDSSYDDNRQWNGLSEFGREVVREMNRLGIMVDVSHITDEAFREVMEITEVPVIASHSSLRHFTPGFERNMSDEMVKTLAENGGVIGINFGSSFLTEEAGAWYDRLREARDRFREENPEASEEDVEAWQTRYREEHPYPYADLEDVLDHIDRVVELAGVDHVGLGSDYDGVGDSLPTGLKDVSTYPNLVEGLLNRGYSEKEIGKILGGNFLRVWSEVEAHAAEKQAADG